MRLNPARPCELAPNRESLIATHLSLPSCLPLRCRSGANATEQSLHLTGSTRRFFRDPTFLAAAS